MATWAAVGRTPAACFGTTEIGGDESSDVVFQVGACFFLHYCRPGEAIAIQIGRNLGEMLFGQGDPPFYSTPHDDTGLGGYVLIRPNEIGEAQLREVLTDAWLAIAPTRLVATWRTTRER